MNENSGDKILTVTSKTLSLKRPVEQGIVRQSFSHGRTKQVVVEKVKRRFTGVPEAPAKENQPTPQANVPVATIGLKSVQTLVNSAAQALTPAAPVSQAKSSLPRSQSGVVLRTLTEEERDARARALVGAKSRG